MTYYEPTDMLTLEAWANWLAATGSAAASRANDAAAAAGAARGGGTGSAVDNLEHAVRDIQSRLQTASDNLARGSLVLRTLITSLDRLGQEAEQRFRQFGSPDRSSPGYAQWELLGDPGREARAATVARQAAARDLEKIAAAAPNAPHHQSAWHRFLGDLAGAGRAVVGFGERTGKAIGHIATDVGHGLKDEVVGIAGLAWGIIKFDYETSLANLIANPRGWQQAWEGAIRTGEFVVTHPAQVGRALWDGLVDRKMFDHDKAAWAILLVANIVGAKGIGKLAGLAKGTEASGVAAEEAGATALTKDAQTFHVSADAIRDNAKSATSDTWEGPEPTDGHTIDRHWSPNGSGDEQKIVSQFKKWDWRDTGGLFTDKATMDSAIQQGITAHAEDIANFVNNPSMGKVMPDFDISFPDTVGRVYFRDGLNPQNFSHPEILDAHDTNTVRFRIMRDPSRPDGFVLRTAFPVYGADSY